MNSFRGSPAWVPLGRLGRAVGIPEHFGLCGGMSFAAADLYLAGRAPPAAREPPRSGRALYQYLYARQTDSLGPELGLAATFVRWMALPLGTPDGTRARTLAELGSILEDLDSGRPAVLGLVLRPVGRLENLWHNHQVLAYGVERRGPDGVDLRVYDPNYPGADGAIITARVELVGTTPSIAPGVHAPVLGVRCERRVPGHAATPVRGLFRMPYSPKAPPSEL